MVLRQTAACTQEGAMHECTAPVKWYSDYPSRKTPSVFLLLGFPLGAAHLGEALAADVAALLGIVAAEADIVPHVVVGVLPGKGQFGLLLIRQLDAAAGNGAPGAVHESGLEQQWLLDIAEETWKLNPRDRFGLLLACCRSCIGAVSVREAEDVK